MLSNQSYQIDFVFVKMLSIMDGYLTWFFPKYSVTKIFVKLLFLNGFQSLKVFETAWYQDIIFMF